LNEEELEAALMAVSWGTPEGAERRDIHEEVEWLRGVMQDVCDVSMPRAMSRPRQAVYWWTEEIADLTRSSVQARRVLSQLPREAGEEEREEAACRAARCALSRAIRKSRATCWSDMLKSLDSDPWGRPYTIVMLKHRAWTPPVTQSLDDNVLSQVVDTIFSQGVEGSTLEWGPGLDGPHEISEDMEISRDEIIRAVRRIGSRKAPGPQARCVPPPVEEGKTSPSQRGQRTGYSVGLQADLVA